MTGTVPQVGTEKAAQRIPKCRKKGKTASCAKRTITAGHTLA